MNVSMQLVYENTLNNDQQLQARLFVHRFTHAAQHHPVGDFTRHLIFDLNHEYLQYINLVGRDSGAQSIMCICVVHSQSDALGWFHNVMGFPFTHYLMRAAVVNNKLDMLQYMYRHGGFITGADLLDCAASNSFDCLQWLYNTLVANNQQIAWSSYMYTRVITEHDTCLQCVQFLHTHGCPWDSKATMAAVKNGNINVLRYLREHGCPWGNHLAVFQAAIESGHSPIVRFAHQDGLRLTREVMSAAASYSQLSIMCYLIQQGCPYDIEDVCSLMVVEEKRWKKHSSYNIDTRGHQYVFDWNNIELRDVLFRWYEDMLVPRLARVQQVPLDLCHVIQEAQAEIEQCKLQTQKLVEQQYVCSDIVTHVINSYF
jgi:hypothetical protein